MTDGPLYEAPVPKDWRTPIVTGQPMALRVARTVPAHETGAAVSLMDAAERELLRKAWEDAYTGPGGGRVVILDLNAWPFDELELWRRGALGFLVMLGAVQAIAISWLFVKTLGA